MATPIPKPKPDTSILKKTGTTPGLAKTGSKVDTSALLAPGAKPKKVTAKKPAAPVAKTPLDEIVSFGQTVLGVISAPLAGVTGFLNEATKQSNAGTADLLKRLTAGFENAAASATGKRTVFTQDVLREAGTIGKKGSGALIEEGTPGAFIAGLAGDILLDPTNLIPGKVLIAPVKVANEVGKAAVKAGVKAADNVVSLNRAVDLAPDEKAVKKLVKAAEPVAVKPAQKLYKEGRLIATDVTPAGERFRKATEKLAAGEYKAVKIEAPSTVTQKVGQVLGSAFDAGKSAAVNTVVADNARDFIAKYARQERKMLKRNPELAVAKLEGESNLAEAATRLADGETMTFPKYTPVVAKNGKTYVSNGKNTYSFPTEAAAQKYITSEGEALRASIKGVAEPLLDVTPTQAPIEILSKLPANSTEAKKAQKTLDTINRLAIQAVATATKKQKTTEVTYDGFEALVAGLKAGHSVDNATLSNIIEALDPSKAWTADVKNLTKKAANEFISNLLVTRGIQTAAQTQERIDLINAATLLKSQGVAYSDVAADYINARIDPRMTEETAAAQSGLELATILDAAREAASERLATAAPSDVARVSNSINRAFTTRFEGVESITDQKTWWEGITNLGDTAVRTSEGAWDADSRAILKLQINQMFQTSMIGSLLGITTYREGKKIEALLDKGLKAIESKPALRMEQFIADMKLSADAVVSTLGSRFVQIRVQDPNLKAANEAHFAFFHLGDIMEAFRETGKADLIYKGFFPTGEGINRKTDSLSFQGLTDAVRYAMEMTEAGKLIVRGELIRRIVSRGKGQAQTTEKFSNTVMKTAEKMADHIMSDNRVLTQINVVHKKNLLAAADEAISSAETLSEDLFNTLINGWRQAVGKGDMSDAKRIKLVKELFARMVYLSGTFKQQGSEVGEAVFRASAMIYLNGGKLKSLVEKTSRGQDVVLANLASDQKEMLEIIDMVNNMYKVDGPAKLTGRQGYEHLPKPSAKKVEKATSRLAEAEELYERRRSELLTVRNKTELTAWEKKFNTAQTRLNLARAAAEEASVASRYWSPEGWKDRATYSFELETATAERVLNLEDGAVNIAKYATDVEPTPLTKLTKEQEMRVLKNWADENVELQTKLAASNAEEAATYVLSRQGEIEAKWDNDLDRAEVLVQMYNSEKLHRGETKVTRAQIPPRNKFVGQGEPGKSSSTRLSPEARRGFLERSGEIWNRTSGVELSSPYLIRAQSELNQAVQSAAHYMQTLVNKYGQVLGEKDFNLAFGFARTGKTPANAPAEMVELVADLRQVFDAFFGDEAAIVSAGLDGPTLQAAFDRYNLSMFGVPNVSEWTPKSLGRLIDELPYGPTPRRNGKNTLEVEKWRKRKEMLAATGENPFLVLSRVIQAIEHAKLEKNLVQNWSEEFSFLKEFPNLTKEQAYKKALKEGYVTIDLVAPNGTNLSRHLPKPEEGGLYHPLIAKEFAAVNREINRLYNGKKLPQFVNVAMEMLNVLKFSQTTANPRHHVTNWFGDSSTAIIGGARDVRQWAKAYQLSGDWAVAKGEADYGFIAKMRGKDQAEMSLARSVRHLQGKPNALMNQEGASLTAGVTINGKNLKLDDATLVDRFERYAVLIGQQQISDLKGLQESADLMSNAATPRGNLFGTVRTKLNVGFEKFSRPFGDFAAAYGNAPRVATALSVMQSRAWKSENEMWAAVANKVHTMHPSTYSLTAFERKYPRLIASYYTWLRVAHNAFLYMAMNHTAAMTVYSKYQYNMAETQGLDPKSIGTPWADKSSTPGYLNYSTYGPTAVGPNGPMLFKPAILPLDVIDTWNIQFDPTLSFDANAIQAAQDIGQGVLGRNINMLLQPGIELITRTDPSTGRPTKINDIATFTDKAMSMVGTTSLLKGLGIYTPSNKGADSTNPLTDRQRELLRQNWLGLNPLQQKAQDIYTGANMNIAQQEQSAFWQRYLQKLQDEQGK